MMKAHNTIELTYVHVELFNFVGGSRDALLAQLCPTKRSIQAKRVHEGATAPVSMMQYAAVIHGTHHVFLCSQLLE